MWVLQSFSHSHIYVTFFRFPQVCMHLCSLVWMGADDVSHCRILSPDKTEWWLISAALCGWGRCFVADQLWLMTRIREEEEEWGASKCHYDDKLADNGVRHWCRHTCTPLWWKYIIFLHMIFQWFICNTCPIVYHTGNTRWPKASSACAIVQFLHRSQLL